MIEMFEEELDRLIKYKGVYKGESQKIDFQILKLKEVILILKGKENNEVVIWTDEYKGFACTIYVCLIEEKDRLQELVDKNYFKNEHNEIKRKILLIEKSLKYWGEPLGRK